MLLAQIFEGCRMPEAVKEIRRKVFVEEQGFSAENELDSHDAEALHVQVSQDGIPIGTGRVYWDQGYHLGRIAVLKEYRGQGAGALAVRLLSRKAFELGADSVELEAQLHAVPFYEKIGFRPFGEQILDENVPHQPMRMTARDFDIADLRRKNA